ncbi:uncharacterized protein LOC133910696 [Phragmites australis]|uniref:uncharacterized protein LOC133910696 n=1 Tax=Phragmites australis TaxID=29695 RepID=UPI002D794B7E|nr:uncharacterized protein LOC133910696 [Phragmites australis]
MASSRSHRAAVAHLDSNRPHRPSRAEPPCSPSSCSVPDAPPSCPRASSCRTAAVTQPRRAVRRPGELPARFAFPLSLFRAAARASPAPSSLFARARRLPTHATSLGHRPRAAPQLVSAPPVRASVRRADAPSRPPSPPPPSAPDREARAPCSLLRRRQAAALSLPELRLPPPSPVNHHMS